MESILKQLEHQLTQKRQQLAAAKTKVSLLLQQEGEIIQTIEQTKSLMQQQQKCLSKTSEPLSDDETFQEEIQEKAKSQEKPDSKKAEAQEKPELKQKIKVQEKIEPRRIVQLKELDEIKEEIPETKHKAYCIFEGPFKGVYQKWEIVKQHVTGKNIKFKGYKSLDEAKEAYKAAFKEITKAEEIQTAGKNGAKLASIQKIRQQMFAKEKMEPSSIVFSRNWKKLTNYTEDMTKECFFPKNTTLGAKGVFFVGVDPDDLYSFFINGLVSDIYLQRDPKQGPYPELLRFPKKFQDVINKFNAFCVKGKEIFLNVTSLYPLFNEETGEVICKAKHLVKLGQAITNHYVAPDSRCIEYEERYFVNQYTHFYSGIQKLGVKDLNVKIQYEDEGILLYTWHKNQMNQAELDKIMAFEKPLIKHEGPYGELPEKILAKIHTKLYKYQAHECRLCPKEAQKGPNFNSEDFPPIEGMASANTSEGHVTDVEEDTLPSDEANKS